MVLRAAHAITLVSGIAALVAAMLVWTAAPVFAACAPRVANSAHASWTLTRDRTSCAPSANQERIGETYERVAPLPSSFVAIGQVAQDPTTGLPREWASFASTTGDVWVQSALPFTRTQLDQPFALGGANGQVVLLGSGFAARTTDGATWEVGPTPPPGAVRVTAVAFGGSATASKNRWLAAGQSTKTSGRLALWLSSDALRWTRIADRTIFGRFCATAVAASARGFVVVGSDCNGRPSSVASKDGVTWRRAPVQTAFGRLGRARDVVATPAGFLAAGEDRSSTGARGSAFWTSTDGVAWRRVAFFSAAKSGEEFVSLLRTPSGYFGISDTGSITDGLPPAAFYSATGATWKRDGLLPNYGYGSEDGDWLTDATAAGNHIVITGHFNDPDPGSYLAGGLITVGTTHP